MPVCLSTLSSSVTPSLFYSILETCLFHTDLPNSGTDFTDPLLLLLDSYSAINHEYTNLSICCMFD